MSAAHRSWLHTDGAACSLCRQYTQDTGSSGSARQLNMAQMRYRPVQQHATRPLGAPAVALRLCSLRWVVLGCDTGLCLQHDGLSGGGAFGELCALQLPFIGLENVKERAPLVARELLPHFPTFGVHQLHACNACTAARHV